MKKEELLGIIGSILILIGVFLPFVYETSTVQKYTPRFSIDTVKLSKSFIEVNQTAGLIIVVLAIISFAFSITKKTNYNTIWGLLSLIVIFAVLFIFARLPK